MGWWVGLFLFPGFALTINKGDAVQSLRKIVVHKSTPLSLTSFSAPFIYQARQVQRFVVQVQTHRHVITGS